MARFHTLRHTRASLLAEAAPARYASNAGGRPLAGSALDTYGHLINGDLSPELDLNGELIR